MQASNNLTILASQILQNEVKLLIFTFQTTVLFCFFAVFTHFHFTKLWILFAKCKIQGKNRTLHLVWAYKSVNLRQHKVFNSIHLSDMIKVLLNFLLLELFLRRACNLNIFNLLTTNAPHLIETNLQCKSINWFLYDGEHWSLMG